jgi:hypothetical protein
MQNFYFTTNQKIILDPFRNKNEIYYQATDKQDFVDFRWRKFERLQIMIQFIVYKYNVEILIVIFFDT